MEIAAGPSSIVTVSFRSCLLIADLIFVISLPQHGSVTERLARPGAPADI
jgi:hypothetical protein